MTHVDIEMDLEYKIEMYQMKVWNITSGEGTKNHY